VCGSRRTGDNTRLAAIRHLMERASAEKPSVVQQADRVAAYFIVALLVLAVVTAAWWWWTIQTGLCGSLSRCWW
jgi:Cu2+-exporting ATPase